MNFEGIKTSLTRLLSLVEEWNKTGVSELERDVALDELRRIYSELRFEGVAEHSADITTSNAVAETIESEVAEADEEKFEEPEIEVELVVNDDEAEEECAVEETPQAEEKEQDTVAVNTEKAKPERNAEQSLFGEEPILQRPLRRRVIMSLYNDDMPTVVENVDSGRKAKDKRAKDDRAEDKSVNVEEKQKEPAIIHELDGDIVLGDVLRTDVHTLGDTISRPKDIAESTPVASLRSAIGINDRFLLIRDLFNGDAKAYDKAIETIDTFDNMDDCMVHIVENYSWYSASDGAKLIMNLIQRKFSKQ